MKNIILFLSLLIFCNVGIGGRLIEPVTSCTFKFSSTKICKNSQYDVELLGKRTGLDEKELLVLHVLRNHTVHELDITLGTIMLDGDVGVVSFEDIDFDGHLDIALSTSFGLPNLYLDYWVYSAKKDVFIKVGNYSKFDIDSKNRVLTNTQKESAAKYVKNTFSWDAGKLIKLNTP